MESHLDFLFWFGFFSWDLFYFFFLPSCLEHPGMISVCLLREDMALANPEAISRLLLGYESPTRESAFFPTSLSDHCLENKV